MLDPDDCHILQQGRRHGFKRVNRLRTLPDPLAYLHKALENTVPGLSAGQLGDRGREGPTELIV